MNFPVSQYPLTAELCARPEIAAIVAKSDMAPDGADLDFFTSLAVDRLQEVVPKYGEDDANPLKFLDEADSSGLHAANCLGRAVLLHAVGIQMTKVYPTIIASEEHSYNVWLCRSTEEPMVIENIGLGNKGSFLRFSVATGIDIATLKPVYGDIVRSIKANQARDSWYYTLFTDKHGRPQNRKDYDAYVSNRSEVFVRRHTVFGGLAAINIVETACTK